jgi:hypothetical protein
MNPISRNPTRVLVKSFMLRSTLKTDYWDGSRRARTHTPRSRTRAAPRSAPFAKEGQRAVLCIVAGEIKHRGLCDLPIDKIAALAGVCRTTVQTTIHEARRLGHIKITERPIPGRKHLPNVVEIASAEWPAWIIILGD